MYPPPPPTRPGHLWTNPGRGKSTDTRARALHPLGAPVTTSGGGAPSAQSGLPRVSARSAVQAPLVSSQCVPGGEALRGREDTTQDTVRAPIAATHQHTWGTSREPHAPVLSPRERQTEDSPPGGGVPGDPGTGRGLVYRQTTQRAQGTPNQGGGAGEDVLAETRTPPSRQRGRGW